MLLEVERKLCLSIESCFFFKERHRSAGGGSRRSRSGSRGHISRRRHRRRRDESGSRGSRTSRAGTPLRDEPDAPPTEPRRPPRERPPLPMSLPLPKFAVQLLRAAPAQPRSLPPAPASPPRPPSASSSSGGSAPHSPSLEERIRSLDEKYERWTGSRAHADAPDRARLRHRLLELDVNEVKPSEVVLSLLAKRSVFDEDSERLEGAARAPSPASSPHSLTTTVPRVLRYPFPVHFVSTSAVAGTTITTSDSNNISLPESEEMERIHSTSIDRVNKYPEIENLHESRLRIRTPSTDRTALDFIEKKSSPSIERNRLEPDSDHEINESKRRNSSIFNIEESKPFISAGGFDKTNLDRSLEHNVNSEFQEQTAEKNILKENRGSCEDKLPTIKKEDNVEEKSFHKTNDTIIAKYERNCFRDEIKLRNQEVIKQETKQVDIQFNQHEKYIFKNEYDSKTESIIQEDIKQQLEQESKLHESSFRMKKEIERCKEKSFQNHVTKETISYKVHTANHLNAINYVGLMKKNSEPNQDNRHNDKNVKEKCEGSTFALQEDKTGKENIDCIRSLEESKVTSNLLFSPDRTVTENDKIQEDSNKSDRDKIKNRDRNDKEIEKERSKSNKSCKVDRIDKDRKTKEELINVKLNIEKVDKIKIEKESEKMTEKADKPKHNDEKGSRHENHKKEKVERERKRDLIEVDILTKGLKREEKHKHDRSRKDSDSKREIKKENDASKSRKSSRDESSRDICRKDSTDSTTSRASHDSSKSKDLEIDDSKSRIKSTDVSHKYDVDREVTKTHDNKLDNKLKIKEEKDFREKHFIHKVKEEKESDEHNYKNKIDTYLDGSAKSKSDVSEKQRHYSVDSPSVDSKRKERLNSCSSLPSHIGHKRRMSSQDSMDCLNEDVKKSRQLERRESKDSRSIERHKTTKFSKGHFAKIIESKTKDDKKNQVKPPDDLFLSIKGNENKDIDKNKTGKKSPSQGNEEKSVLSSDASSESIQNNIDFLATLELRSSEEDERQKAMRKEMKEKKRIQQLQQIQELQMQQDALQQAELSHKIKDERKVKNEDKKKECAREKRMSTDRKSKDERNDPNKRRNRKQVQSTDTSDSDEPKKHSIFDIIDDEPTYISMYDKVKARSCKNMQKQEEEKRQEKIKAKFSQLKQSRAKREEKKRSSWDEDSDSDNERRKSHKASMDSSSDDDQIVVQSKRREKSHGSSLDYGRSRTNEYYDAGSNEEDSRNKLSRKNSRTRIMSDTSDDENNKRNINRSPSFIDKIKKEIISDSESSQKCKDAELQEASDDKVKKTSLLNLFGKSDSEDNRMKSSIDIESDYRMSFAKSYPNDISSENESIPPNRNISELRKKHKKKQKKYKFSFSDDDTKLDNAHETSEIDTKHKISDKSRRHSNRKEKRKDKIRESIDTDEIRDDKMKVKKERCSPNQSYDIVTEAVSNNNKKEGKMEDIFGPLSDESDRDSGNVSTKTDALPLDFETQISNSNEKPMTNNDEIKIKEKDDIRRKREKKRKDKRHFVKDDDNSLDVDAVSKAIEARLFADTSNIDESRPKSDNISDFVSQTSELDLKYRDIHFKRESLSFNKYSDKSRKESREKKKKKKKNREDRQSRKEHHHGYHHEKIQKLDGNYTIYTENNPQLSPKTMLLDIPLPNDIQKVELTDKSDDSKSLSESPSLPRITDSPPFLIQSDENNDTKVNVRDTSCRLVVDDEIDIDYDLTRNIEVNDIPMPPPIDNIVQDISEVPLPKDPPLNIETNQQSALKSFNVEIEVDTDVKMSEEAVRSIPDLEKETEKQSEKIINDSHCKAEKKIEEKPRAVISQEETEDAVAALLGESFGGKANTFDDCYEEVENNTVHQIEIENTPTENEVIPEEDAEEMRQAVQNLNASEMEIKPATPLSDNDLLLIDTDTEETEDINQEAIERLPVNVTTNQNLNNNTKISIAQTTEASSIIVTKPKTNIVQAVTKESTDVSKKSIEDKIKPTTTKSEIIQQITSTATPVITSWTLSNNKLTEPHLLNIPSSTANRDSSENKPTHITANIVQIKTPQNQNVQINNSLRPIINPSRVNPPYQVINQMIRPQIPSIQPPTIKIPDSHIIYQKPQGIVISPRMSNEPILLSPKTSQQSESMTSPRLTNMAILSTSSQNINSVGLASPTALQQRSPGQVTVVRMQQPPLSPIQTMHIPHGARTMVSPNRPNSVLVQTQGAPIHFNRLPVTPVLAPISKQINPNNVIQQSKPSAVNNAHLIQQQKNSGECRKSENIVESAKVILSPTRLPSSGNHTIMTQNRLIPMQNALHVSNINSALHLSNKVLMSNKSQLIEKRENQVNKSEHNHVSLPLPPSPIIHVANVSHSTSSIIQGAVKSNMCNFQETPVNRGLGSNVIHSINSQRLLTTSPITNVLHLDANKGSPSVLSMASTKPPCTLSKSDSSNSVVVTTSSLANVVMTPLLLKSPSPKAPIRLHSRSESDHTENNVSMSLLSHSQRDLDSQLGDKNVETSKDSGYDNSVSAPPSTSPVESIGKCETDFEELLKDNTNEIKLSNDPDKKVEINVGKTITLIAQSTDKKENIDIEITEKEENPALISKPLGQELTKINSENDYSLPIIEKQENNLIENDLKVVKEEKPDDSVSTIKDKDDKISPSYEINDSTRNPDSRENKEQFFALLTPNQNATNEIKSLEESDYWTAKDVNIESVIKKVDSLCNDNPDENKVDIKNVSTLVTKEENKVKTETDVPITSVSERELNTVETPKFESTDEENKLEVFPTESNFTEEHFVEKNTTIGKRGGRNGRGKRSDKNQDRIQTRQIAKPSRGTSKRGRGRLKVDKKVKNLVSRNLNNMPGDVYDFHEDSGDETVTSPNKNEVRPRLILTIKSPLSGHSNAIPTSTLSITQKDQLKSTEKSKEEKSEVFASPSTNTRKSRRLQEKDIQRSTVDDIIDDVIKSSTGQYKNKESNKKRSTRQTGAKTNVDKVSQSDTRKSPRGVKRLRDRSLSDASLDSSDENVKRDDGVKEAKILKLVEPVNAVKVDTETTMKITSTTTTVAVPPSVNTTPIMKPPKKMISEISAKLASAFEAAANATNRVSGGSPIVHERPPLPDRPLSDRAPIPDRPPLTERPPEMERLVPAVDPFPTVPCEVDAADAGYVRRIVDNVPSNMMPVGATEATDARVQSPALPHRPPSAHHPPDRATPILVR